MISIQKPAKNMYNDITAHFFHGNDNVVGTAVTFRMASYLDEVKTYDPDSTQFVNNFLEYGMRAGAYFGSTPAPASTKTYDYDALITEMKTKGYDKIADMGSNFVGATLLLKSTPILRLYYNTYFEGAQQNEQNPDLYYTEAPISPAFLTSATLNDYNVCNYIYKALQSDNEELKALCASLYVMCSDIAK